MTTFSGTDLVCARSERTVFAGLGFEIQAGGALVLVGPNGSGKSSLLRLLAGLARPAAGTLIWGGEDVAEDAEAHRSRLHYVGHADAVKPVLTVAENLSFWASLRAGDNDLLASTAAALEAFGIGRLADVPGRFLSAGQRRRLALARVLAAPATLWLLDEPRTALDAEAQAMLDAVIARHRDGGGMVIMALHGGDRPERTATLDLSDFSARGHA